jgi:hypothetical protein
MKTRFVGTFPPALGEIMSFVAAVCQGSELLRSATTSLLGGLVFLRLVCPLLMKRRLQTAKLLQAACNNPKHVTALSIAVRELLATLVKPHNGTIDGSNAENNLTQADALRLIQVLALQQKAVIQLLREKGLAERELVEQLQDSLSLCDPFRASVAKTVLSRTSSPSIVERAREEKDFFARHGLSERFVREYFDVGSDVEGAVRVAALVSNSKFGVPSKKGLVVGRDLVDWLVDICPLVDRPKAVRFASDLAQYKLLLPAAVPDSKALKRRTTGTLHFSDGDTFYRFDLDLLAQLQTLLDVAEEIEICPQCRKKARKIEGAYCEYCGYE